MSFFKNNDSIEKIALVKRFLEYSSLMPGFDTAYRANPEEILKKYQIPLTEYDLKFTISEDHEITTFKPIHPNGAMAMYVNFVEQKLRWREDLKKICEPANPTFKKWRARQIARCNGAFSLSRSIATIHEVLAFELSAGCSIGCPFCGLSAGKLSGIYRYSEKHAHLWQEILEISHRVIGEGATIATCYYGTEPLDNPDYELFIHDYCEENGRYPQMTTAGGCRDITRLRKLISEIQESDENVYRISVRSLEEFELLMKKFTARELVMVELLPQYEEAPRCKLEKVGRNADEDVYGDTICCVSGFIVNMQNQTIKLVTPVPASKEFPNGQAVLMEETFTDAASYEEKLLLMIGNMKTILSPKEILSIYPYYHLEKKEDAVKIKSKDYYSIDVKDKEIVPIFEMTYNILNDGKYTRKETADLLSAQFPKVDLVSLFSMINQLWNSGVIIDNQINKY